MRKKSSRSSGKTAGKKTPSKAFSSTSSRAKPRARKLVTSKGVRGDTASKLGGRPGVKSSETAVSALKVRFIEIDEQMQGQRIDNFLFREFKGVPKSRIYKALRDGEVRVDKKRVKAPKKLALGEVVRLPPLRVAETKIHRCSDRLLEQLERAILFENADLIVVNKPSGLAVHGGSGINSGLIEALRQMRPECKRLELVHRLDRDTSGCTLVAKKSSVLRFLHQQLREKTMEKTYLALVAGRWPKRKQMVNLALDKNQLAGGERIVRVSPEGKPSKTAFAVVEALPKATLLEAKPITGRTHQIRVHTQATGHAILGDEKYGEKSFKAIEQSIGLERLFLHAHKIEFALPEQSKRYSIQAPLPDDLNKVVENLRRLNDA